MELSFTIQWDIFSEQEELHRNLMLHSTGLLWVATVMF